jgi:bifunctional DNase/RNase
MVSELIPITFHKVMQTRSYTVVVMKAEEKRFAIYVDPSIGRAIQMELIETKKARPLTHDLMNMVFRGLNVNLLQVVINDIEETIYFARLFLECQTGDKTQILEIDARPSDCITLAIMNNTPVYCTQRVLEKTVLIDEP